MSSFCVHCRGILTLIPCSTSIDGCQYKCNNKLAVDGSKIKKKICGKKFSIRNHSWFSHSHLTFFEIMTLTYYWWHEMPLNFIESDLDLAHSTPIDWANFCREVAEDIIVNNSQRIGGPGIIVEIDESKFGKRKYNRGKMVEGVWVFGGVERITGNCFLVVVKNRTATTLLNVIKEWIKPETTIISDCWKAYDNIQEHNDYKHLKVNHSVNFKDPDTGAHTNQIEGLWNLAKKSLPSTNRNKQMFSGYLASFMLRCKWNGQNGFALFIQHAAKLYSNKIIEENTGKKLKLS